MRTLGLLVKSGLAISVQIEEADAAFWRVLRRDDVLLTAESGPYARFPFHPLIELDSPAGLAASRDAVAIVRAESKRRLRVLLESVAPIDAVGLTVGSLVDPKTIANPHIRAHASEGLLFREVILNALDEARIPHWVLRSKDAYGQVAVQLPMAEVALRGEVETRGRGVVKPWRADEKLAAVGALWALAAVRTRPFGASGSVSAAQGARSRPRRHL
jgi:hypothetical protein